MGRVYLILVYGALDRSEKLARCFDICTDLAARKFHLFYVGDFGHSVADVDAE
jgi:hypothetical protein